MELQASKEKVWDVLLLDKFNKTWFADFSQGMRVQTNWKIGSKALYTDNSNGGIICQVVANKPQELLTLEFTGLLVNGKEDYDSVDAREFIGGKESYRLLAAQGATKIFIETETAEQYYDWMQDAWDKALHTIKKLSEDNA